MRRSTADPLIAVLECLARAREAEDPRVRGELLRVAESRLHRVRELVRGHRPSARRRQAIEQATAELAALLVELLFGDRKPRG